MKKTSILSAFLGLFFIGAASAADIVVYHSPYCPHCHHAREFIGGEMIYVYPKLKVTEVDVMSEQNLPKFEEALSKCKYDNGGVPVIVIGDKCFQGYADFMQQELRDAVEIDMSAEDKKIASENKKSFDADPEKFKADRKDRLQAITTFDASKPAVQPEKKIEKGTTLYFWAFLAVLVIALGVVLVRKKK